MSIRDKFVEDFGEEAAAAIESAAHQHGNGINNQNIGSDPFRHSIVVCLGYECMSKYKKEYGIKPAWARVKKWIKDNGQLDKHDGDCDYIFLMTGGYSEYMPKEKR